MSFDKETHNTYEPQHQLGSASDSLESSLKSSQSAFTVFIEFLCILILAGIYTCIELFSLPTIAYLTCDQTDILLPYRRDTITTLEMIIFGFLFPTFFIILIELINSKALNNRCSNQKKINDKKRVSKFREYVLHAFTLFLLGMFVTVVITEVVKRWVGRLRPHFLDVCKPRFDNINCYNNTANGYISNSIYTGGKFCTGDYRKIKEARLSFPSGHASFSTYCMVYLILFLESRLFVNRLHFGKRLIQFMAVIAAIYISLSRIFDNQHRASDVIGGIGLGLSVAVIASQIAKNLWPSQVSEKLPYFSFESIKSISDENIKASSEDTII